VERLEALGLKTAQSPEEVPGGARALIRSHGESRAVLEGLESSGQVAEAKIATRAKAREEEPQQMFFVDEGMETAKRRIREVDIDTISPLEALNLLYELKKLVK